MSKLLTKPVTFRIVTTPKDRDVSLSLPTEEVQSVANQQQYSRSKRKQTDIEGVLALLLVMVLLTIMVSVTVWVFYSLVAHAGTWNFRGHQPLSGWQLPAAKGRT